MPTIRTTLRTPEEIAARQVPRDDVLVAEREVAPGRFVGVEGPFSTWERSVEVTESGAHEHIVAKLAAPHWAWFMHLVLRRPIRTGVPHRAQTPWWAPGERITQRDATVMGLCATLSLIAGFLGGLVGQTIAYIADDLGGDTKTQATALAVIRVGAVLTFIATALADRRGRKPMLRATLVIASGAALVSAIAPTFEVVTVSQLICRGLVAASAFLVPIVCAEELPARSRSYAIGLMALPGGLGVGMVLWMLPLMSLGDSAWRILYACGAITLVVTLKTVARLPESRRFVAVEADVGAHARQHISLVRFALLGATMVLLNLFTAPTQQMQTDYLSNTRDMSPSMVALFMIATNTWGFAGVAIGAQLSDRNSRRLALAIGMVGLAFGNALMYNTDGPAMWIGSLIGAVVGGLVVPSLGAVMTEMFPTLRRGAANGLMNGAGVCGSIIGLLVVARFVTDGDYAATISALAIGPIIVAMLIWGLPESSGKELEELNPGEAPCSDQTSGTGATAPGATAPRL